MLSATLFSTPLGNLYALSDKQYLYLLIFEDQPLRETYATRCARQLKRKITPGTTPISDQLHHELTAYFKGSLEQFTVPLYPWGTDFQQHVWAQLKNIPYGTTHAYATVAQSVGNPRAFRAVARANATNPFILLVPCHRVIQADGKLGGYAGFIERKKWLLEHEKGILSVQ